MGTLSRGLLHSLPVFFILVGTVALPLALVSGLLPGIDSSVFVTEPSPTAAVEVTETEEGVTVTLLDAGTSEAVAIRVNGTVLTTLNRTDIGQETTIIGVRPNDTVVIVGKRNGSTQPIRRYTVQQPHNASAPPSVVGESSSDAREMQTEGMATHCLNQSPPNGRLDAATRGTGYPILHPWYCMACHDRQ